MTGRGRRNTKRTTKRGTRRTTRTRKTEDATCEQEATVDDENTVEVEIAKFCKSSIAKGIEGMKAEFASLASFTPKDTAANAFNANQARNRFKNIPCYDKTRVILKYQVPPETDYIHANWIDHPTIKVVPRYMCAQAPLPNTINDFWRLIWQEKPRHVLVLCQLMENNKPKCADYFPRTVGETRHCGNITVECVKTKHGGANKYYETFEIKASVDKAVHLLLAHQWTDWPDFGVPQSGDGIIRLLRGIRADSGTTAIIHCSAGVGRTGTIMSVIIALKALQGGNEVNVLNIVKEIRSCRANAVQTEAQYLFIYKLVFDFIKLRNKRKVPPEVPEFYGMYGNYKPSTPTPSTSPTPLSQSPAEASSTMPNEPSDYYTH